MNRRQRVQRYVRQKLGIIGKKDSIIPWQRILDPSAIPRENFSIEAALEFPAVKSAVDTLASEVSNMESVVETQNPDTLVWEPLRDTYADARLVAGRWNPNETAELGIEWLMRSVLTWGFGAAYVQRVDNNPIAIFPLDPSKITRNELNGRITTIYDADVPIVPRVLPRSSLIWIDFEPPFNRVDLVSPLFSQWRSIRGGLAVIYFLNYFFDRGGLPSLFFVPGDTVSEDNELTNKEMNEALQEMRKGGYRSFVIPEGYGVQNLSVNPQGAAATDLLLTAIQNVARIYRIPPIKLQDLSRSTFANYNGATRAFQSTARHWARKLSLEISSAVWPRGGRRLVLKSDRLDGESFRDTSGGLRDQVFAGILSQNDARAKLQLPPDPSEEANRLIRTNNFIPEDLQPEPPEPVNGASDIDEDVDEEPSPEEEDTQPTDDS